MKELLQLGSCEWSGLTSGWLCVILWSSVLLCSEVGSTFYCPRFWRVLWLWSSNRRRSGSWPFFFWPCCLSPPSGVGSASAAWRVLAFTCAMPCGVFLAWLAGCSPGSLPSCFERLVFLQGASGSTPLFSRGEGRGFWCWHGGTGVATGSVPSPQHGVPLTLGRCVRLYLSRMVCYP